MLSEDKMKKFLFTKKSVYIVLRTKFILAVTMKIIAVPGYMHGNNCLAMILRDKDLSPQENNIIQILAKSNGKMIGATSSKDSYFFNSQNRYYSPFGLFAPIHTKSFNGRYYSKFRRIT